MLFPRARQIESPAILALHWVARAAADGLLLGWVGLRVLRVSRLAAPKQ